MCSREVEVLDALRRGHVEAGLREHIARCQTCRDLSEIAGAVLDDRTTLMRNATLPSSGLVWWRATMRERREAARAALRTARIIQVALVVAALSIAIAVAGPKIGSFEWQAVVGSLSGFAVPVVAFVAWLILAPVAVYFVVTEE